MRRTFALLLACAPAVPVAAQAPDDGARRMEARGYARPARTAGEVVRAYMDASGTPGMSVAVAVRGRLAWSQAFGYADLERRVPADRGTRFRLGSVSKLFAAAAVAKLAEEGALALDEPVARHVPAFGAAGERITPRQLAGHLGGIRHYRAEDFAAGRNIDQIVFPTTGDALALFRGDTLLAPPGTRYHYSTFGYTLLSAAVEGAAGEDFLAALDRLVVRPLALAGTGPDRGDPGDARRTRFYTRGARGAVVEDQPVLSTYKWAGGGLLATADDLARFGSAHLRPGFFRAATLRELFTSQSVAGQPTHVGLGWRLARDAEGRRLYHHAGSMEGCRSVLVVYPEEGVVVALLSNRASSPHSPELMAQLVAAPFLRAGSGAAPAGWMPPPPALAERVREAGFAPPDSLRVVPLGAGALAVASPVGVHLLRPAGSAVVWALQRPELHPVELPVAP